MTPEKQKTPPFADESDFSLLLKVVEGKISRNKNFDFFKSVRGQEIFKKAKMIKGLQSDIKSGCVLVDEKKDQNNYLITIENNEKNYKRTVFFDKLMYDVFSTLK